jgi:hypothetical protein
VYGVPAGSTVEVPVSFSRATLFEPGSAAATTFTGEFSNACAAGNMTLNSVKLDVIGTL